MLFLKILLGVVLAIVLIIAIAFFWIRSKLKKISSEFSATALYLPPIEARLRLSATSPDNFNHEDDASDNFQQQERLLIEAGFEPLGYFYAGPSELAVTRHANGIFGIVHRMAEHVFHEYCAVDEHNHAFLITPNPIFPKIDGKSLTVTVGSRLEPAQAIAGLSQRGPLRKLSVRQFVLLYERLHNTCMDARLGDPQAEKMVKDWIAFADLEALSDDDMENTLEQCQSACDHAIEEAIHDNARQAAGLDDDSWSRIEDDLLIITRNTNFDEIGYHFDDELAEGMIEQFQACNMSVQDAFNATNRRMKKHQQFALLTTVRRPLPANVYAHAHRLESIDVETPGLKEGPGLQRFLYQSKSEDGEAVKASLVACNVADVRTQLQRMGHTDVSVFTSNRDIVKIDTLDKELFPDTLIEAQTDSIPKTVIKTVLSNWILWLPFAIWAGWTLFDGPPYDWVDWLALTLSGLTLGGSLYLAVPMLLYNAILEAVSWGRTDKARKNLKLLRAVFGARILPAAVLDLEEAKILATDGHKDEAIAIMERHKDGVDTITYMSYLGQIHDAAGDYPRMIDAFTEMLEQDPRNEEFKVELALALLRYTNRTDDAENLLRGLHPHNCSDLFVNGLYFAQGLLSAKQGQQALAIQTLGKALQGMQPFNLPIIGAMRAEIRGYIAVYLRQLGETEKAEQIWRQVFPRLRALNEEHVLKLYQHSE